MLADPTILKNLDAVRAMMNDPKFSTARQAQAIKAQPSTKAKQAGEDIQTAAARLGKTFQPVQNRITDAISGTMDKATAYMIAHPEKIKALSDFLLTIEQNAEKFLVGHKADFQALGDSMATGVKAVGTLWPEIKFFSDVVLTTVGSLARVDVAFNKFFGMIFGWVRKLFPNLDNHLGNAKTIEDWIGKHSEGIPGAVSGAAGAVAKGLTSGPAMTARQQAILAAQHRHDVALAKQKPPTVAPPKPVKPQGGDIHKHQHSGNISFVINGAKDPRAVRDAVMLALNEAFRSPRSAAATSGKYRTHPDLPIAMTVGVG